MLAECGWERIENLVGCFWLEYREHAAMYVDMRRMWCEIYVKLASCGRIGNLKGI